MQVKNIKLKNLRNYNDANVQFRPGKNIVIGENAQGKTNLLEAVDLLSTGKSQRASEDKELVAWGANQTRVELIYEARNYDETLSYELSLKEPAAPQSTSAGRASKLIKVNGVKQQSVKGLLGRLITVSFTSEDLKILRGGPKYRRDWLDTIAVRLKPSFHDTIGSYTKSLMQRNKLLKQMAERGRVTVSDQDELLVWDKQLAKYGTFIIKMRLKILADLLPVAEEEQSNLSRKSERLTIDYAFRAQEENNDYGSLDDESPGGAASHDDASAVKSMEELQAMEEIELARLLMKFMKERRWLEMRRKQSLVGPHRDNLIFKLNGASAAAFASQGQQRSIVLSLKLAELKKVEEHIGEAPILLLDDVLAELDEKRAALLLGAVTEGMQTIMSTTHLSAIDAGWLEDAHLMTVSNGNLLSSEFASLT